MTPFVPGLFPQEAWQARLDAAFPQAVNVRILVDDSGHEVDFSAACINVVGEDDGNPVIWFVDGGNNGKAWQFPCKIKQVQTAPWVAFRVARLDDVGDVYLFWPRPVQGRHAYDLAKAKTALRQQAAFMRASI